MIRFPKMHIASSVVNRILNAADELESRYPPPVAAPAPSTPGVAADTSGQSLALDAAISAPLGELPPLEASPDPGGQVSGKPTLSTLLQPK